MNDAVVILGQGAWGTALGRTLSDAGAQVRFWRRGGSAAVLEGAGLVLSAVPAQATRDVLAAVAPALPGGVALVLTAKGLEKGTLKLQSEIAAEVAPGHPAAILTGPSFASDLTTGLPTAVTLAMADTVLGEALQRRLATPSLRPYLTDDIIGAQIGGAVKNVIAIACGAVIGAGLGESARAALMTRGFAEMLRIGTALGGRAETLGGLSGLGDLALTCASESSRNFAYGLALGRGTTPPALAADGRTYEGAATAGPVAALAARLGVEMPLAAAVAALVAGRLGVPEAIEKLFNRPLRRE
ncbi:MAG TPA: NAD(P)H-dependent glycerol-3-phosphate dehydrogenase [Thermohalobaculum sp.]|nr:NAD(P)H-dependent glycerol-3-phosphate dehydrogenase [Thermohalobaculum sp.]